MKRILLLLLFMAFAVNFTFGQVAFYDDGRNFTAGSSSSDVNGATVNIVGLTDGSDFACSGTALTTNNWQQSGTIDLNEYLEYTITINSGCTADFTGFSMQSDKSGSGPANWEIRSSADSYSSTLSTGNHSNSCSSKSGTFNVSATSSITFRIYGYNSGGTGGNVRIGDVSFNGSVTCGPACPVNFSNPTTSCVTNTNNTDTYNATVDFSGAGTSGYSLNTNTGTIVASSNTLDTNATGTIEITGAEEDTDIELTITGNGCNNTFTITSPSCIPPPCGVTYGTATYACSSNTAGANNDAVTVTVPYTGFDGTITGVKVKVGTTELNPSDVSGTNPAVEAGSIIFTANEGDSWTIELEGVNCDLQSISGMVPSGECDPIAPNPCSLQIIAVDGGNDIVYLRAIDDIPGNTTFYLTDNEWDSQSESFDDLNEQEYTYTTPADGIASGSIIELGNTATCGTLSPGMFGVGNGEEDIYLLTKFPSATAGEITASDICFSFSSGGTGDLPNDNSVNVGDFDYAAYNGTGDITDAGNWTADNSFSDVTFPTPSCTPAPPCTITLGTPYYECSSKTNGTASPDAVILKIPYTGSDSNVTVEVTTPSSGVTAVADFSIADDEIEITGLSEGDSWAIALSGSTCNGQTLAGAVPETECEPLALVISEIMYDSGNAGNDDEWIEICNTGTTDIDVSGFTIDSDTTTGTPDFTFPASSIISAGDCVTIALGSNGDGTFNSNCAFTPDFGLAATTDDTDNLSNSAVTTITFLENTSIGIDAVTYNPGAPPTGDGANGNGASLHIIDVDADNANTNNGNWQEVDTGGSPGENALLSTCAPSGVYISEVAYNPCDAQGSDANCEYIIITNSTPATIDISGWKIQNEVEFTFPASTTLASGESIAVGSGTCNAFNFDLVSLSGSLSNSGGTVELENTAGTTVSIVTYDGSLPTPVNECQVLCYNESAEVSSCDSSIANPCGITFEPETYSCTTTNEGDNNDDAVVIIAYQGMNASATISSTLSSNPNVTITGDLSLNDAEIRITGLKEGDAWDLSILGGGCDSSFSGTIPSSLCDPATGGCANRAGGLLINEFSNGVPGVQGVGGSEEYIELVVLGDPDNPTAPVNVQGFILDDNNGDFNDANTATDDGVSRGYATLSGAVFQAMSPGDIIVIYNNDQRNSAIPADDETDSNDDGVYIFPANSSNISSTIGIPIVGCTPSPVAEGTSGCSQGESSYSDQNALNAGQTSAWSTIGYSNEGDAAVVRCPDDPTVVLHALVFGTNQTNGVSGAVYAGNGGSDTNWSFGCNSMYASSAFEQTTASDPGSQTPGASNNPNNQDLINALIDGSLDYSSLYSSVGDFACRILPVELATISAQWIGESKVALVSWTTLSETNNDYFELEHSIDGMDWAVAGVVPGNGSTDQSNDYSFAHTRAVNGINYYRLKQVDFDGTFAYSDIVSVTAEGIEGLQIVAVNKEALNITTSLEGAATFEVYNSVGALSAQGNFDAVKGNQSVYYGTELASGFYVICLTVGGQTLTEKFIVQ